MKVDTREMDEFDWMNHTGPVTTGSYVKPVHPSVMYADLEGDEERKMRMLIPLSSTCIACSMCELGRQVAVCGRIGRDPHLLSSMKPSKYMVVGVATDWCGLETGLPISSPEFGAAVVAGGLTLKDFYACNLVRCFPKSVPLTAAHFDACEAFLRIEIGLLRPRLVVALGSAVFERLCPGGDFTAAMLSIVKSDKFGVRVLAAPSPLEAGFVDRMVTVCALITEISRRKDKS